MMVTMIVPSNNLVLISHVVSLRTGLDGVNKNNEVGPWSATPSFFFFATIRRHTQPARAPQNGDRERYRPPTRSSLFKMINITAIILCYLFIMPSYSTYYAQGKINTYLGRLKCIIGSSPL